MIIDDFDDDVSLPSKILQQFRQQRKVQHRNAAKKNAEPAEDKTKHVLVGQIWTIEDAKVHF